MTDLFALMWMAQYEMGAYVEIFTTEDGARASIAVANQARGKRRQLKSAPADPLHDQDGTICWFGDNQGTAVQLIKVTPRP